MKTQILQAYSYSFELICYGYIKILLLFTPIYNFKLINTSCIIAPTILIVWFYWHYLLTYVLPIYIIWGNMGCGYEKNFVFFIERRITYSRLTMIFQKSIVMPMFSICSCVSKRFLFTCLVNITQKTLNIDLQDQFIARSG